MGIFERSRMFLQSVVLLAWFSLAHTAEVSTLEGIGPAPEETTFDEGADIINPTSLFPGPRYGLPGYKESHQWVDGDYDIFSPLIFDAKWYALNYDLGDKSEGAVRADWKAFLADAANAYPADCRQGNALFSPQKYYRANPSIKETLEMNGDAQETCGSIVKAFMKQGIVDAQSRFDPKKEAEVYKEDPAQIESEQLLIPITKLKDSRKSAGWAIGKDFMTFGTEAMPSTQQYTLSFWYRPMGAREPESNILHHGDSLQENSPRISQAPGGANMLKFVVSQSNDDGWGCTPTQELEEKKWHFVSLVVEKHKISVEYDGENVCTKENDDGFTKVLEGRNLYVSSPFLPGADGYIQKLSYYPEHVVKNSLLAYTMEESKEQLEEIK